MVNIFEKPKERYLSISQINTYMRCPMQWKFRYIDGLIKPPNFNLVIGSAVHKGIETNFEQKIKSKEDLAIDVIKDAYSDEFEKRKVEIEDKEEKTKEGKSKDLGYKLSELHHQELAPRIQPNYVEKEFYFKIPKTEIKDNKINKIIEIDIPWAFKGYIDLIDDLHYVIDNKTSGRKYSDDSADESLQLIGYSYAYKQEFGQLPQGIRYDVLIKTKIPVTQQVYGKINQDKINQFLLSTFNIYKAITSGIFYPRKGTDCSWCGYKEECSKTKVW